MAIQDFGKKIGGARKDLWAGRGLRLSDLEGFNTAERDKFIKKNNIWLKPDYEKLLNEEGYTRNALYFIKTVRDAIPTAPELSYTDTADDIIRKQDTYIDFLDEFKQEIMKVKTDADIDKVGINYLVDKGYVAKKSGYYTSYEVTEKGQPFINNKFFKALQMSSTQAEREANRKEFLGNNANAIKAQFSIYEIDGDFSTEKAWNDPNKVVVKHAHGRGHEFFYPINEDLNDESLYEVGVGRVIVVKDNRILFASNDYGEAERFVEHKAQSLANLKEAQKEQAKEASNSKRKKGLVPPILAHVERTGPDVRIGDVTGQDFLDTFKIKGGEFGNWLNEAERQTNMNMAFDSFKDLAKALNINDEDISMGGKLSMAFGSRGVRGAAAHYEPLREVINLTKMKGAGSLAHEFFHGMDDITGKEQGIGCFATEAKRLNNAFTELVDTMKYKTITVSAEEQNKETEKRFEDRVNALKAEIQKMVPDGILTSEKIAERDRMLNHLIEKAKDPDFRFMEHEYSSRGTKLKLNPEINEISKFIDSNAKFYKMTTGNQQWLCNKLDAIGRTYNAPKATEPITRKVETDFYQNAKRLDGAFSKTTHGYWQSNIEMGARAFACYVHDKLEEKGIKNDYLTGHAFQCGMDEKGTVPTFPQKDERESINKVFDKVIEEMKEINVFHERIESEIAIDLGDHYITIQETDSGYEYNVLDKNYNLLDGGVYDDASVSIRAALDDIVTDCTDGKDIVPKEVNYDVTIERMSEREDAKIKEAQRAARQESLGGIDFETTSFKQMTFDDMLGMLKERREERKEHSETTEREGNKITRTEHTKTTRISEREER